jgi:murein DD-endopeptidase MepM/ murein hydrolase activator NlpD
MAEPKEQNYGGLAGAIDITKINPYGVDDARLAELRDAQQKSIEALQNRYDKPNWFKVAAGFAKPQLGGFLASLGSASEALGENVEQQRAQQLPISQMKIQMAQQNILLGNKQKAASIVAQAQREGRPLTPKELNEITNLDESRGKAIMESQASQLQQKSAEQKDRELLISQANALRAANQPVPKWLTDAIATQPTNAPSMMNPSQAPQTVQGRQTSGEPPTATPATQTLRAEPDLKTHSIATDWQMPIPTSVGTLTSPYGTRTDPITGKPGAVHTSWDIGAPQGTPIQTVGTGKIKNIQTNDSLGNSVTIDHGRGYEVRYSHLDSINPDLKIDNAIQQQQLIGNVGSTGRSTGPHLDMTVFKDGKPIDPAEFFGNPWKTSVAAKETVATPETTEKPKTEEGFYPHTVKRAVTQGMGDADRAQTLAANAQSMKDVEAPIAAKYATQASLFAGNPPEFTRVKNSYDNTISLINDHQDIAQKVFSLVRNGGPLAAALDAGIGINTGSLVANIHLPIEAIKMADLKPYEQAYADRLFSSLVQIAMGQMKESGLNMNNIPQGEFMKTLSQYVTPQTNALTAIAKLSEEKENFNHRKEFFDVLTRERAKRVDPNSPTPYADVVNNSEELKKLDEKYQARLRYIQKSFSEKIKEEALRAQQQRSGG